MFVVMIAKIFEQIRVQQQGVRDIKKRSQVSDLKHRQRKPVFRGNRITNEP